MFRPPSKLVRVFLLRADSFSHRRKSSRILIGANGDTGLTSATHWEPRHTVRFAEKKLWPQHENTSTEKRFQISESAAASGAAATATAALGARRFFYFTICKFIFEKKKGLREEESRVLGHLKQCRQIRVKELKTTALFPPPPPPRPLSFSRVTPHL